MTSCLSICRCLSRKRGKDHPAPKPWSWQTRLLLLTWVAAVAGLVTGVSLYIYGHLQDTGVSLGKQKIMLNRSVAVKASIFANDAEHDAALVRVANMQNLCNEEKRGWKLNCRVLMAYENFAGRISKEDYEQARGLVWQCLLPLCFTAFGELALQRFPKLSQMLCHSRIAGVRGIKDHPQAC